MGMGSGCHDGPCCVHSSVCYVAALRTHPLPKVARLCGRQHFFVVVLVLLLPLVLFVICPLDEQAVLRGHLSIQLPIRRPKSPLSMDTGGREGRDQKKYGIKTTWEKQTRQETAKTHPHPNIQWHPGRYRYLEPDGTNWAGLARCTPEGPAPPCSSSGGSWGWEGRETGGGATDQVLQAVQGETWRTGPSVLSRRPGEPTNPHPQLPRNPGCYRSLARPRLSFLFAHSWAGGGALGGLALSDRRLVTIYKFPPSKSARMSSPSVVSLVLALWDGRAGRFS
ncbi:hypothetical protein IF1G_10010 [Cordyceps javanica]|uniref:Uncharacterized protein n=1 Tax=Cordyceps javanica TaxID=43265 RepID=A0A545UPX3_9HYPO|nr:hypothetical protein IF1G_10010 [Cordyceps javanica]